MLRELGDNSGAVPLRSGDDDSNALRDRLVGLGVSARSVWDGLLLADEFDELRDDVESEIRVGSDEPSKEREDGFERDSGEEGRSSDGVDLGEDLRLNGGLGSRLDLEEEDENVESEREVVKVGVDDEGLEVEDEF